MSDAERTAARDAALRKAQAANKALREAGKIERLSVVDRAAKTSPPSKAVAIKAMCWDCVGRGDGAGAKADIAKCSAFDCPIWPLRPWKHLADEGWGSAQRAAAIDALDDGHPTKKAAQEEESRRKAIDAKCYECMGGEDCTSVQLRTLIATCSAHFPQGSQGEYRGCPIWPHRRWKTVGQRGASV